MMLQHHRSYLPILATRTMITDPILNFICNHRTAAMPAENVQQMTTTTIAVHLQIGQLVVSTMKILLSMKPHLAHSLMSTRARARSRSSLQLQKEPDRPVFLVSPTFWHISSSGCYAVIRSLSLP